MHNVERVPNERLIDVWNAFEEAGRRVVYEMQISEDELHVGAQFLQELGARKFLVGLVDTVLATAASEGHAARAGIQKANLEGPLYLAGAPVRPDGNIVERRPTETARSLRLSGRVFDQSTGSPVAGAEMHFWQADEYGLYDLNGYNLRGVLVTDDEGLYELRTIVPAPYTLHEDDMITDLFAMLGRHAYRSAHIHLKIFVGGHEVLTTQFYDPNSEYLDTDYVSGAVRPDLMMEYTTQPQTGNGEDLYEATMDFPLALSQDDAGERRTTRHVSPS